MPENVPTVIRIIHKGILLISGAHDETAGGSELSRSHAEKKYVCDEESSMKRQGDLDDGMTKPLSLR